MAKGKLLKRFSFGPVNVSLFENPAVVDGKETSILNLVMDRGYVNDDGKYLYTNNFDKRNIDDLIYALKSAKKYINDKENGVDEGEQQSLIDNSR